MFEILKNLSLTSKETRKLFSKSTRDIDDLNVWRDEASGVIYIDDYYTGDLTYQSGNYRTDSKSILQKGNSDFEVNADAERRFKENLKFVAGKKVVDFGCGSGEFLQLIKDYCVEVTGIELQSDYIAELNERGIKCLKSVEDIDDHYIDTFVSFHVLEHLPDPLTTLKAIKKKIVPGGVLVIEVPHARDFLLSSLNNDDFKSYTLWSQHLVLHTRDSLQRILTHAGFEDVLIRGVQRYPLSNHLTWLTKGVPGGHKSAISSIDTQQLTEAYSASLANLDATDTLVAVAKAR